MSFSNTPLPVVNEPEPNVYLSPEELSYLLDALYTVYINYDSFSSSLIEKLEQLSDRLI